MKKNKQGCKRTCDLKETNFLVTFQYVLLPSQRKTVIEMCNDKNFIECPLLVMIYEASKHTSHVLKKKKKKKTFFFLFLRLSIVVVAF